MRVMWETAEVGPREARRRLLLKRALEVVGWLVAVGLLAFAGRAVLAAAPARQGVEPQLTAREERGARELAARFAEGLRPSGDLTPLLDELFVEDFGERLRGETSEPPTVFVAPEVLARAEPGALRGFYAAAFNYISLLLQHSVARCLESEAACGAQDNETPPEQRFPPGVLAALREEPLYLNLIASAERDEACARGVQESPGRAVPECQGDEEMQFVNSLEELDAATAAAGKVAAALRRHVPPLPSLLARANGRAGAGRFTEVGQPALKTFEREKYGFPPGTRFASVRVHLSEELAFDLLAVESGGASRLLSAFPVFGH